MLVGGKLNESIITLPYYLLARGLSVSKQQIALQSLPSHQVDMMTVSRKAVNLKD